MCKPDSLRRRLAAVSRIVVACVALSAGTASAHKASFVSIDRGQQTLLTSINASGEVVGFSPSGAFVREPDGTITSFTLDNYYAWWPTSINDAGYIAGFGYHSSDGIGFIRNPDGTITTFAPPGAQSTQATAINASQTVTGSAQGADHIAHGFVRRSDGTISVFDPDGADYTFPYAINDAGVVVGLYGASGTNHGFLRNADGTIVAFDVPGASMTQANFINAAGWIVGTYRDAAGQHGFLRNPDGVFTTFDDASRSFDARCVNNAGVVTGMSGKSRGFIRKANGKMSYFKVPGDKIHKTSPACLNDDGVVIGTYFQVTGSHTGKEIGFIRIP